MPREDELSFKVRNCFDELVREIDRLKEELECLEDRVSELEEKRHSVSSKVESFRLERGEIRGN